MSGGYFDYKQYAIQRIADHIEQLIISNGSQEKDRWGDNVHHNFSQETITAFEEAVYALRKAQIYAHRVDWLISGDDSEQSFHARLKEDIKQIV